MGPPRGLRTDLTSDLDALTRRDWWQASDDDLATQAPHLSRLLMVRRGPLATWRDNLRAALDRVQTFVEARRDYPIEHRDRIRVARALLVPPDEVVRSRRHWPLRDRNRHAAAVGRWAEHTVRARPWRQQTLRRLATALKDLDSSYQNDPWVAPGQDDRMDARFRAQLQRRVAVLALSDAYERVRDALRAIHPDFGELAFQYGALPLLELRHHPDWVRYGDTHDVQVALFDDDRRGLGPLEYYQVRHVYVSTRPLPALPRIRIVRTQERANQRPSAGCLNVEVCDIEADLWRQVTDETRLAEEDSPLRAALRVGVDSTTTDGRASNPFIELIEVASAGWEVGEDCLEFYFDARAFDVSRPRHRIWVEFLTLLPRAARTFTITNFNHYAAGSTHIQFSLSDARVTKCVARLGLAYVPVGEGTASGVRDLWDISRRIPMRRAGQAWVIDGPGGRNQINLPHSALVHPGSAITFSWSLRDSGSPTVPTA